MKCRRAFQLWDTILGALGLYFTWQYRDYDDYFLEQYRCFLFGCHYNWSSIAYKISFVNLWKIKAIRVLFLKGWEKYSCIIYSLVVITIDIGLLTRPLFVILWKIKSIRVQFLKGWWNWVRYIPEVTNNFKTQVKRALCIFTMN